MPIQFTLAETLEKIDVAKTKLAREAKVRPATVYDIVDGKAKRIDLETLTTILDTLARLAAEKQYNKKITIENVLIYV